MTIAVTIAIVVIVVVVLHLIGGWVYASGFRHSALTPKAPSRSFGVWVRSIDKRAITLSTKGPRQDVGHPGVLGLYWEGGYLQIGEVVGVEGFNVTRSLPAGQGQAPPLCPNGPSDECTQVDLEAYAYPNDPGDVGLGFENIAYESGLGPTHAWVVPATGQSKWAIHVHGWTAERREAIRLLPTLHDAGVTSMVIDYRNDPGAPKDPTGRYRFGLSEWEDVEGAVRHALGAGAEEVILIGYSTGAAHIMSFLERSDLSESVTGNIFDSPNINLLEAVRHGSRGLRFDPTPIPISRLMAEFGMWIADLRWKIDWETTNYVQRAQEILRVPTLVFHGTSDQRIPILVSRQLEARAGGVVSLVETPAAGHVMSWNAGPDRYERYLRRFLEGSTTI